MPGGTLMGEGLEGRAGSGLTTSGDGMAGMIEVVFASRESPTCTAGCDSPALTWTPTTLPMNKTITNFSVLLEPRPQ